MEGDSELQDLYREVLLDYFRSGAHKGKLDPADYHAHGLNPVCGDEVELTVQVKDGKVFAIRFSGHGCVISQASSAMMAESLEGATLPRAKQLVGAFKDMMLSKSAPEAMPPELEAVNALAGVRKFALRVKCATLAWNTLLQGLERQPAASGPEK
ncbi:MAG: Fe-S cluster assembly sulfur transfer protein SufU [Elusimicrobiota bacterium]